MSSPMKKVRVVCNLVYDRLLDSNTKLINIMAAEVGVIALLFSLIGLLLSPKGVLVFTSGL